MIPRHRIRAAKNKLRAMYRRAHRLLVRTFRSYGSKTLVEALRAIGVERGDTVMLHSAFEPEHGFRGTAGEAIDAFLEALGPDGHLMMVSLPYRSSSLAYLRKLSCFDVRRTPSAMGLMSEFFRHRAGVLRSLHPTHPVLVFGPRAEWFVAGHEKCLFPCGPGTPFEKLLQVGGKVVFFNVGFDCLTFFHYLEHRVSARLPFPLYTDQPFDVPVIDNAGSPGIVRTYVFAESAIRRRRFRDLHSWVKERGFIREVRVGGSYLLKVEVCEIANLVEEMAEQGVYFYTMESVT